jgi:hypothetical protein
MTTGDGKLFDKLSPHYEPKSLPKLQTKATGPRCPLGKDLARMKTATQGYAYGEVNITADNQLQFLIRISIEETEASTWGLCHMECITNQLERESHGITSNGQSDCKKVFAINLIDSKTW